MDIRIDVARNFLKAGILIFYEQKSLGLSSGVADLGALCKMTHK